MGKKRRCGVHNGVKKQKLENSEQGTIRPLMAPPSHNMMDSLIAKISGNSTNSTEDCKSHVNEMIQILHSLINKSKETLPVTNSNEQSNCAPLPSSTQSFTPKRFQPSRRAKTHHSCTSVEHYSDDEPEDFFDIKDEDLPAEAPVQQACVELPMDAEKLRTDEKRLIKDFLQNNISCDKYQPSQEMSECTTPIDSEESSQQETCEVEETAEMLFSLTPDQKILALEISTVLNDSSDSDLSGYASPEEEWMHSLNVDDWCNSVIVAGN
jgi:hypothetical protein